MSRQVGLQEIRERMYMRLLDQIVHVLDGSLCVTTSFELLSSRPILLPLLMLCYDVLNLLVVYML
jgi:hypothetical protein